MVITARLLGKPEYGHWIGYFVYLPVIALGYLLVNSPRLGRPALYYIQIGLVLAWLLVEALLDYILRIEFRQVGCMVISYVTLIFAASGGMVGVASIARLAC